MMFVNKKVFEIVLFMSGSTNYEFSAAIFIDLSEIIMDCLRIQTSDRLVKDW